MKEYGSVQTRKGNSFAVQYYELDGKYFMKAIGPLDGGFVARAIQAETCVLSLDDGPQSLTRELERKGF